MLCMLNKLEGDEHGSNAFISGEVEVATGQQVCSDTIVVATPLMNGACCAKADVGYVV